MVILSDRLQTAKHCFWHTHVYMQTLCPCDCSSLLSIQAPGDVTSFLMTEARQHNTEIRMAVSKVVDKMDHLAAKVMCDIDRLVYKLLQFALQM